MLNIGLSSITPKGFVAHGQEMLKLSMQSFPILACNLEAQAGNSMLKNAAALLWNLAGEDRALAKIVRPCPRAP